MNREAISGLIHSFWPADPRNVQELLESEDLHADGWLTSFTNLQLVVALEKETGKKIPLLKVSRGNFKTVKSIENLLKEI